MRHPSATRVYPKENPRWRCNDRKVKAQQVVYKPAVGYVGDDVFELQVLQTNGQVFEYVYHLKVVGKSGGRADIRP